MGYLNKVLLIGRLGRDPEKRVTGTGTSVVNFPLATTDYWTDQSGSRQEKTEWHRIVLWNRLADNAEQFLKKGSQLYVEGKLQTREWTDKEGQKRYTTEIVGVAIQFLDSKGSDTGSSNGQYSGAPQGNKQNPIQNNNQNSPAPNSSPPQQQQGGNSSPPNDDFIEDDIPF